MLRAVGQASLLGAVEFVILFFAEVDPPLLWAIPVGMLVLALGWDLLRRRRRSAAAPPSAPDSDPDPDDR